MVERRAFISSDASGRQSFPAFHVDRGSEPHGGESQAQDRPEPPPLDLRFGHDGPPPLERPVRELPDAQQRAVSDWLVGGALDRIARAGLARLRRRFRAAP